jgi:hypothetical protein
MRPCRSPKRARKARGRGRLLLSIAALLFALGAGLYARVTQRVLVMADGRLAVQFRQLHDRWSRVSILDVDLTCPGVRIEVAAADATQRYSGCADGTARTVADWCRATGAIGGVNGGFFGRDLGRGRKEIVGLLKLDGDLYARAPRYRIKRSSVLGVRYSDRSDGSDRSERRTPNPPSLRGVPERRTPYYAHSALGIRPNGRPVIDWVVSDPRRPSRLLAFEQPDTLRAGLPWDIQSGLSGGPRLIARGRIAVTDHQERLASSGLLPRTFVGYSAAAGTPRHLVLGVATAMTFQDAARFLDRYFRRFHNVPCAEAMCLDGGPSSQLAYRADGVLYEAQSSDTTVPTCLLIHSSEAD